MGSNCEGKREYSEIERRCSERQKFADIERRCAEKEKELKIVTAWMNRKEVELKSIAEWKKEISQEVRVQHDYMTKAIAWVTVLGIIAIKAIDSILGGIA